MDSLADGKDNLIVYTVEFITEVITKMTPNTVLSPGDYVFVHRIIKSSMVGAWWTDCFSFSVD